MKEEFAIEDEWLPYEIHPETPPEGVLLKDYFPGFNPEQFFRKLDTRGEDMGVRFGPQALMSNSRKAMEAGEYARDKGLHEEFHSEMFKAYFTDCRDIGDRSVIDDVAEAVGLDVAAMNEALDAGTYFPRLEETTRNARMNFVSAAPTFIIEDGPTIAGAQHTHAFRKALREVVNKRESQGSS